MKKTICLFLILSFCFPIFSGHNKKNDTGQFRACKKGETLTHLKRRYPKNLIKKNLVNPDQDDYGFAHKKAYRK